MRGGSGQWDRKKARRLGKEGMGPSPGYAGETWTSDQHVAEAVSDSPSGVAAAEWGAWWGEGRGAVGLGGLRKPGGGTGF